MKKIGSMREKRKQASETKTRGENNTAIRAKTTREKKCGTSVV